MILFKKYVLEYFLEKISELTPYSNQNNKKYYVKKTKSLASTKKHFNDSQSITGVELKEFSLLYLVLNNLSLLQANIHLICLLYTSPSPRDGLLSRMPSSA